MQVSDTELAWAAGIIDGEGCFHCRETKGKRYAYYMTLTLSISQKHPEILHRFQQAVGQGVVNGPYVYGGFTHYQYRVTGRTRVIEVAKLIWPYLSTHKRRQCNEALRKYRKGPENGSTGRLAKGT